MWSLGTNSLEQVEPSVRQSQYLVVRPVGRDSRQINTESSLGFIIRYRPVSVRTHKKGVAMISSSLVQNLRQQLMLRLPFSGMAIEDVDLFIEFSSEVYFAPNEVILSPADGSPACLYLIRQGRVSEKRISPRLSDSAFELEAGELFSVRALDYTARSVSWP